MTSDKPFKQENLRPHIYKKRETRTLMNHMNKQTTEHQLNDL